MENIKLNSFLNKKRLFAYFLFVAFLTFGITSAHAQDDDPKKTSDEEGSAQFMIEQMPALPAPQLIRQPGQTPTIVEMMPGQFEPKKKGTFSFLKNWFNKDEGKAIEDQKADQSTADPQGKDAPPSLDELEEYLDSKKLQTTSQTDIDDASNLDKQGSPQFRAEQIAPMPAPKPIMTQQVSIPSQASTVQATPATVAPKQTTTVQVAPTPVVAPQVTAPVVTAPSLPSTPAVTTPSIPKAAPVTTQPSQAELDDLLPKVRGLYLVTPLEQEMWDAARNLDFEKAIELRNKIEQVKNLKGMDVVLELERKMAQAAKQLDFEKAIEFRNQIRTLQEKGAVPALVKAEQVKFTVKGFSLTGNNLFTSDVLLPYTENLLNKEITLDDVRGAASEIKKHYRKNGYIAAYVYIPPQALKDGILEMQIIEGKLGSYKLQGNKYFSDQVLLKNFNLQPGDTVSYNAINGYLSKLNEHRDINVKAIFQPGEEPGTTDLVLDADDQFPFHASVDYNNFGTKLSGQDRFGTTLTHTNLFGNLDELNVRVQGSEGSRSLGFDYNTPLWDSDIRAGIAFTRGDTDLSGDFKALNAEGYATNYSVYGVFPIENDLENIDTSLRLGFDHKSVENRLLNISTGKDELRIINGVINVEQKDEWGATYWPHSMHFGVDAFGASAKGSESLVRSDSGAPFLIYRSQFDRFFYLPNEMTVQLHSAWQLTPDKLPSSEQFQLGGFNSVRGYPTSEYLGDYGALISAELSTPLYFIPKELRLPFQKESLYDSVRAVGFWDYGTSTLKSALPGELSQKTIQGAGFGFRFRLYDRINARVEYAFPLSEDPSNETTGALYTGISMDII